MADRFYKDIELPNLPLEANLPTPDAGFIQVYGKDGKLAYKNDAGTEVILDTPSAIAEGYPVFIQETAPATLAEKYVWIQIDGGNIQVFVEDGL